VALVVVLGAAGGATWAASKRGEPAANTPTAPVAEPSADPNDGVGTGDQGGGKGEGEKPTATTKASASKGDEGSGAQAAGTFTFDDPEGWDDITSKARESSSVGNRVVRALARVRDDGTGSSIVVTSGANPAPGSQPSTETLGAALRERTVSEGATEVSQPRTITMADGQAVVVDYKGSLRGQSIAGRRVLTVRGGNAYVLVLEGTEKRFDEDLDAFDAVIESWTWKQ